MARNEPANLVTSTDEEMILPNSENVFTDFGGFSNFHSVTTGVLVLLLLSAVDGSSANLITLVARSLGLTALVLLPFVVVDCVSCSPLLSVDSTQRVMGKSALLPTVMKCCELITCIWLSEMEWALIVVVISGRDDCIFQQWTVPSTAPVNRILPNNCRQDKNSQLSKLHVKILSNHISRDNPKHKNIDLSIKSCLINNLRHDTLVLTNQVICNYVI